MSLSERTPVVVVTLLALGSGIVNVYSVLGRGVLERVELLRRIFPLEFIHLSRSATLLAGFTLIVASLNVYRRKRLALWLVSAVASLSVVFHLTKGLDYEEALLSLTLLIALFLTRRNFTVRSRHPNWTIAIRRVLIALSLAVVYGIAGFWFLDPREFGINFDWRQSVRQTFEFLTLRGDPALRPHTHYAEWFLDSLYLMTSAGFIYSLFALFRPVLYRFRTHPHEVERALQILREHGTSSQDFFKARPDKSFFFSPDGQCFLAYRVGGSFALVLGDPVGPTNAIEGIVHDFIAFCEDNGWGVGFYQVPADFLPVYQNIGLNKLKIGDDAIVDLARFTLEGKSAKTFRSKVGQLEKAGIHTDLYNPPVSADTMAQIRQVSDEWLQIPGRRERQFTLGMFNEQYLRSTPVFAAVDTEGRVLAFVNIIRSYRSGEASVDLMRRRSDAPNGIMDYVFIKLILHTKAQGLERFNLGMAPMAGFAQQEEASPEERAIHAFFQHLNFLFSFRGLHTYKAKFASVWEPRYLIYRNILDLPRAVRALTAVSEVDNE